MEKRGSASRRRVVHAASAGVSTSRPSDAQPTEGSEGTPPPGVAAVADLLRGARNDRAPTSAEQLLSDLLDLSPDAVVLVGPEGRIELINRQTEALFGYAREELLGQPVERLIPARFFTSHQHHRQRYVSAPRTRPMGTGLELFGCRKDGSEFPVEISLSPFTVDGTVLVIGAIRDVTERKALEEALRASERRAYQETAARLTLLQTILDEIPLGIYLVRGFDARLVLANRAVASIWGADWPEGQPLEAFLAGAGTRIFGMSGQPLAGDELATLRALRTQAPVRSQQEVLRHRDGTTLPVLVNAIPLNPGVVGQTATRADAAVGAGNALAGNALAGQEDAGQEDAAEPVALVVHQDVTALREAERLKDEFVAMAAHELRNPMGTLRVYGSMLRRDAMRVGAGETELGEWQAEALDGIEQVTRQLVSLTDDLLDVTKLQAGGFWMQPEPHDLAALVRRVVGRIQRTTERHHLILTGAEEPIVVQIDVKRMEQVVTNLLSNAIKYSPAGGDILLALTRRVADGHDVVELTVHDAGIGIAAEDQAHIFSRFARGANARARQIEGTGLGLYLCRELVERQGGQIWFESSEAVGTTFHVRLPLLHD
ncbi:MAG TPA: ATP-binding protein [Ktedonobacterales bacterium]|nr:ATP-binding protein [Ktedonobacterales bacterium]